MKPYEAHGLCVGGKHDLYPTWTNMRQRCSNPKNPDFRSYGGRGIRVCERWQSFANFLADVGERRPGMSIDRIDVNGHYEPGNVRWADAKTQASNTRGVFVCGDRHGMRGVLTEDSVFALRRVAALGLFSQRQLAKWWGITEGNASEVLTRKTWRHIQ